MKNIRAQLLIGIFFLSIGIFPDAQAQTNTDSLVNATLRSVEATVDSVMKKVEAVQGFSAVEKTNTYLKNSPVVVTDFHVKININPEEAYFDVEETYEVLFNVKKHGIYRNIPLVYHLSENQPGGDSKGENKGFWAQQPQKHRIDIDKVEVPGHKSKVSGGRLSDMLNIRIGDAGKLVEGPQKYTIKYRVEDAFLYDENAGYFYWNLMGAEWDFHFLNTSFEVQLPQNPQAEYFVYSGHSGSTTTNAQFEYKNGLFSGKSNEILGAGKDMTLLLKLPVDYITRPSLLERWWKSYGWVIFPPIAFLLFYLAWNAWGRDKKLVKAVEYFPPKDMDPALAGYLVDEDADTRDLTALIPHWGAQGLLSMEIEKPKKKGFKLKIGEIVAVALGGIYLFGMLLTVTLILASINAGSIWNILGTMGSLFPFVIVGLIVLIRAFKNYGNSDFTLHRKKDLPSNAKAYERTMFDGLFSFGDKVSTDDLKKKFYTTLSTAKSELLNYSAGMYFTKYSRRNIIITAILCILVGIVGGIGIGILMSLLGGILFFFTCLGLSFYSGAMRKRLVKGDETLQKLEGFRMFLKKAKKKELEWLVNENPTYFEETLAYAVAFGLVEKYSKKFEGLVQAPPQWYSGGAHFTMTGFSNSFNSAMRSTASTFVSRPSSSGSGGSGGGGGFSGGGFGGGGGGSW
jgi:uncharacterized membrane protein YgcG